METITLTFGDRCENHVGMQIIGNRARAGVSILELHELQKAFSNAQVIDLSHGNCAAAILVARGGISDLITSVDDLFEEQQNLEWDTRAFMYGRVVNKHARHNLCFGDEAQEPDYEKKKGCVVAWSQLVHTSQLKDALEKLLNKGTLVGEGNRYYDIRKCGIGYHGDSERRIVVGCRLGAPMDLHFRWYREGKAITTARQIPLCGGDLYIMSEKAVGYDWKTRKQETLRHSTGCKKFTD